MKRAYKAMFVNPQQQEGLTGYSIDETQQKKYEKHRDILVTRGVLFKEVSALITTSRSLRMRPKHINY